jgi:alginate O-acetyltransferase complex protein AlgI
MREPFRIGLVVFSSVPFLFYFLPAFFVIYCLAPGVLAKNLILLLASLLFYAWGEPWFVLLLWAQTAFNYAAALAIGATQGRTRFLSVTIGVGANLALLGLFKYADFAVSSLNAALRTTEFAFGLPGLALPLGISFFTFHSISYLVDVYRGDVAANRDPLQVTVYIAMFRNWWRGRSSVITRSRGGSANAG